MFDRFWEIILDGSTEVDTSSITNRAASLRTRAPTASTEWVDVRATGNGP